MIRKQFDNNKNEQNKDKWQKDLWCVLIPRFSFISLLPPAREKERTPCRAFMLAAYWLSDVGASALSRDFETWINTKRLSISLHSEDPYLWSIETESFRLASLVEERESESCERAFADSSERKNIFPLFPCKGYWLVLSSMESQFSPPRNEIQSFQDSAHASKL